MTEAERVEAFVVIADRCNTCRHQSLFPNDINNFLCCNHRLSRHECFGGKNFWALSVGGQAAASDKWSTTFSVLIRGWAEMAEAPPCRLYHRRGAT